MYDEYDDYDRLDDLGMADFDQRTDDEFIEFVLEHVAYDNVSEDYGGFTRREHAQAERLLAAHRDKRPVEYLVRDFGAPIFFVVLEIAEKFLIIRRDQVKDEYKDQIKLYRYQEIEVEYEKLKKKFEGNESN